MCIYIYIYNIIIYTYTYTYNSWSDRQGKVRCIETPAPTNGFFIQWYSLQMRVGNLRSTTFGSMRTLHTSKPLLIPSGLDINPLHCTIAINYRVRTKTWAWNAAAKVPKLQFGGQEFSKKCFHFCIKGHVLTNSDSSHRSAIDQPYSSYIAAIDQP